MNLTAHQMQIVTSINNEVEKLIEAGKTNHGVDEAIIEMMPDFQEGFKHLLDTLKPNEMNRVCQEFPGFYRFAKLIERIAEACREGIFDDILPPRETKQPAGHFQLPPDISFQKKHGPAGWVYTFRHQELGQLGRILLQDRPGGLCQITCEIAGDPDDPMTEKRKAVFGPVAMEIARQMDLATGGMGETQKPTPIPPYKKPPKEFTGVPSKHMQCEKCGAIVAVLIFADEAEDTNELEDYARLMFPKIKEWNLPTWIIGPPIGCDPQPESPAPILKVWPKREPLQNLRPDEFNPIIDELISSHCS